jgi:hypothetical protein
MVAFSDLAVKRSLPPARIGGFGGMVITGRRAAAATAAGEAVKIERLIVHPLDPYPHAYTVGCTSAAIPS